jgi:hypothetical protein
MGRKHIKPLALRDGDDVPVRVGEPGGVRSRSSAPLLAGVV